MLYKKYYAINLTCFTNVSAAILIDEGNKQTFQHRTNVREWVQSRNTTNK